MNSIICESYRQMCLYMCVMVDQREALAVTTRLTDTVYFGSPYWDSNVNLWISKQQPCILPLSYLVLNSSTQAFEAIVSHRASVASKKIKYLLGVLVHPLPFNKPILFAIVFSLGFSCKI
jgi:hypothetical protein